MKNLIFVLLLFASCSLFSAEDNLNYKVEVMSHGKPIRTYKTKGEVHKIEGENIIYFTDSATLKVVELSNVEVIVTVL